MVRALPYIGCADERVYGDMDGCKVRHTQITELVFIGIEKAPDVSGAFLVYTIVLKELVP
jgi:hypothetical protein